MLMDPHPTQQHAVINDRILWPYRSKYKQITSNYDSRDVIYER